MSIFIAGVIVLSILAFFFVVWPLISNCLGRKSALSEDDLRQATNVALYRDHLEELNNSRQLGSITDEQYRALNAELERNLLADSVDSPANNRVSSSHVSLAASGGDHPVASQRQSFTFFGLLLLIVLVSAALLYEHLGGHASWQVKQALDHRYALEDEYVSAKTSAEQQRIQRDIILANQSLMERLLNAVESEPNNLQTRSLLGRTAAGLGDYPLAIEQFRALLTLEPSVLPIRAELAQALFLTNNNRAVPEVRTLAAEVLAVDPENTLALSLSGISAFQSEAYAEAITFWEKMIAIEGPNSPNSIALQQGINTAKKRLAAAQGVSHSSSDKSAVKPSSIALQVIIDDGLAIDPNSIVFVYARAWQGAKMPLSIARYPLSELPEKITLTNAMAMSPQLNLDSATEFELVARISSSGSAIAQSGDWEATLGPVTLDPLNSPHILRITSRRP
ncbi:c-type cytochrome biogenesis protein CcmI [Eionea flava]